VGSARRPDTNAPTPPNAEARRGYSRFICTPGFAARVHVSETAKGCGVSGVDLWSTAIPYNQTNIAEAATASDGWAAVTFNMQDGFPANPGRQHILAVLVRATQRGGSELAGVSTRRVLAQQVDLR